MCTLFFEIDIPLLLFNRELRIRQRILNETSGTLLTNFSIHITLYGALLLLDSSIRYLLSLDAAELAALENPDPVAIEDWRKSLNRARFTVSSALTTVIICITAKALLNKSLDTPGTLLVNNRYIRMAPRLIVVIVAMCLPIKTGMAVGASMGVLLAMLLPLILWEYIAAMERGSRLIEPKEIEE